ncbi:MAG: hypothetical protein HY556_04025 [Euryarchaeota archaeon]|nr:hypothetical protein [Euryarchaeota archaeon]
MDKDARTILAWTFAGLTMLLLFAALTGSLAAPVGSGLFGQFAWVYAGVGVAVYLLLVIIHPGQGKTGVGP